MRCRDLGKGLKGRRNGIEGRKGKGQGLVS